MSTAALSRPPNEITVQVKCSPATLSEVVQRLVGIFTSVPVTVQAEPPESAPAPADPVAGVASTKDPPLPTHTLLAEHRSTPADTGPLTTPAVTPPVPELPAHLEARYYLGRVCKRAHRYEGTDFSVRKRSNGGCAICNEQYTLRPRPVRRPLVAARGRPTPAPERPELPAHLALTAFLSRVVCTDPTHRYRGLAPWTLRYQADETCVQCVTAQSQQALAGD